MARENANDAHKKIELLKGARFGQQQTKRNAASGNDNVASA